MYKLSVPGHEVETVIVTETRPCPYLPPLRVECSSGRTMPAKMRLLASVTVSASRLAIHSIGQFDKHDVHNMMCLSVLRALDKRSAILERVWCVFLTSSQTASWHLFLHRTDISAIIHLFRLIPIRSAWNLAMNKRMIFCRAITVLICVCVHVAIAEHIEIVSAGVNFLQDASCTDIDCP